MATVKIKKKSTLRPDKARAYAEAVRAAHDAYAYKRQREVMLEVVASNDALNGIDNEKLIAEAFERIKSFDDGTNKGKGRKKK